MIESILPVLPPALRRIVENLPESVSSRTEELRIRQSRPLEIVYGGGYAFIGADGRLAEHPAAAYRPDKEDVVKLLELLTNHSVYSFEEELKRGFITIAGGHRVGLAGRTVLEQGKVKQIRDITSFNIRIAREIQEASREVLPYLLDSSGTAIHHTLVISPPQHGKTTLIRDLARNLSYGRWPGVRAGPHGFKVGVVDERSEIAACDKGVPRFDLGPRTDVLDGCPKAEGMMMMIRSLSPDVLVVDEIGRAEDAGAIHEAVRAGIRVLATAHGSGLEDVKRRPVLQALLEDGMFARYIVLQRRKGGNPSFAVFDGKGMRVEAARNGIY